MISEDLYNMYWPSQGMHDKPYIDQRMAAVDSSYYEVTDSWAVAGQQKCVLPEPTSNPNTKHKNLDPPITEFNTAQ